MSKKFIQIYDTTLRDGMQGMEISFTLEDKIEISKILDEHKIDYIEGGFPLSNEKEQQFFKKIKHVHLTHSKVAAFGSTRKPNTNVEHDLHTNALLDAETEVVTVVAKSSSLHVTEILKTDLDENLHMIFDTIKYLKDRDREVILDLEHFFDGSKHNFEYALKVLQAGYDAGVDILILCDTNGGTLPHEVKEIMNKLKDYALAPLGVHFHNDCELAVANSLEGVFQGAIQIQGTINGWGERAGNANLVSIIPNLILKNINYTAHCEPMICHLTSMSRSIADIANIIPETRQPFVGHAAFSHKAGQHADVLIKATSLMEHLKPESVGNERHVILSELAGKSTIVTKLAKFGDFTKNDKEVNNLILVLKQKEHEGFEYESAEASFELEILKELNIFKPLFELKNFHLEMFKTIEQDSQSLCRLFLRINGAEVMGAGIGLGPVETVDRAIRSAIKDKFPEISNVKLVDYKVRVINPESSVSAKVRVLITHSCQGTIWSTIGVHENIVEASWQALVDGYNYYYNLIHLKD